MEQARNLAAIAHDPSGFGWGRRGNLRVPWYPDGKVACRWCGAALPPRRRSWCGSACVDAYTIRSHWQTLRVYVIRRDERRCQKCAEPGHEVDHILACIDGGTDDPLNLRLLCVPCHKLETRTLSRRRAAERRSLGLPLEG